MIDGRSAALAAVLLAAAAPARAQVERPIPPAVVDARFVFAGFADDEVTAAALDLDPADLPGRGIGVVAGLHLYPIRRQGFAIGIGGEIVRARGSRVEPDDDDPLTPAAAEVRRRLQGLSGNLSINFGHRDGWSYLTAGMGPLRYDAYVGDAAPAESARTSTINMGGGARWFLNRHVALNVDVRFYLTRPEDAIADAIPRQRRRLMFLSAGISVK